MQYSPTLFPKKVTLDPSLFRWIYFSFLINWNHGNHEKNEKAVNNFELLFSVFQKQKSLPAIESMWIRTWENKIFLSINETFTPNTIVVY